jgi:hypothetical protein
MEESMENRKFWLGIFVMVLIFGVSDFANADPVDSSLNGTWYNNDRDNGYIFNNGVFEFYLEDFITMKGTYTTSSGRINMTYTHVHGAMFGLENRFYTIREVQAAPLQSWQRGELLQIIGSGGASYSVIGNRLTIRFDMEDLGTAYLVRR